MCWSLMDGVENLDEQVCSVLLERSGCNLVCWRTWSPCCTSKELSSNPRRGSVASVAGWIRPLPQRLVRVRRLG